MVAVASAMPPGGEKPAFFQQGTDVGLIVVTMFCLHFLRKPPGRNSASFSIKRMEPVSESCLQAASRVLTTRSSGGRVAFSASVFRVRS